MSRTIPLRRQLAWRLFGRKAGRDQWAGGEEIPELYQQTMEWSRDDIAERLPEYSKRLEASVGQARGRVLELGCGIGNMTRWIANRGEVSAVTAVDGFQGAIEKLQSYGIQKVTPLCMDIGDLEFEAGTKFDTVVICELIEHLYPDEEQAMIASITPWLVEGAGWVVSTPIGWLEDPHHVRAFSKAAFNRHLRRLYGEPQGVDYASGYSQVAWGKWGSSQ